MANPLPFRLFLGLQCHAMDPVHHHQQRHQRLLQCVRGLGQLDLNHLHGPVYSVYFPGKLFTGKTGTLLYYIDRTLVFLCCHSSIFRVYDWPLSQGFVGRAQGPGSKWRPLIQNDFIWVFSDKVWWLYPRCLSCRCLLDLPQSGLDLTKCHLLAAQEYLEIRSVLVFFLSRIVTKFQ